MGDDDEAGQGYVSDVITQLSRLSPQPTVYRINVAGLGFKRRGEGADAVDFIAMHGDNAYEAVAQAIDDVEAMKLEIHEKQPKLPEIIAYEPFPVSILPKVCT